MNAVNLAAAFDRIGEPWKPTRVATVNDYDVRLVKVAGEFVWHDHADTDELFLVINGRITIQLRNGDVELGPGEMYVVPRGVQHCPRADEEAEVLLLEPSTVVNTGAAGGPLTTTVERLD